MSSESLQYSNSTADGRLASPRPQLVPTSWVERSAREANGLKLSWRSGMPVAPARSWRRDLAIATKRLFDIVGSLGALAFLLPLLVVVAVLIKRSSEGPIFFSQKRRGIDGRIFTIYKFRTMFTDRADPSGARQTVADDARVTPIGRFIRRTSIDELPQLFNVLVGDMSIIGPRPYPLDMLAAGQPYRTLVPYFTFRELMKPGLSGWAQAQGLRGPTVDEEMARRRLFHDIAYIQNFSLLLDFQIVALTIAREIRGGTGF